MIDGRKLVVVLGGGGVRGLAHIGVLKALHRLGLVPDEYVGTSVGGFVAAMAAGGLDPWALETVARSIRRRDVVDLDWLGWFGFRGRCRSLYRGKALHDLVRRSLPVDTFDALPKPLFLSAVDLTTEREVVWGTRGFRDIPVHDCVVASCAIPGVYPPKRIGPFRFVDGSLVDTLPVGIAVDRGADLIVAVHLDPPPVPAPRVDRRGIGAILERSQSILSRRLRDHALDRFDGAPIVLIQPPADGRGLFDFSDPDAAIRAGERAAEAALRSSPLAAAYLAA
jgi:NTE family protein